MKKLLILSSFILSGVLGATLYKANAQECTDSTSFLVGADGQCMNLQQIEASDRAQQAAATPSQSFQRIASFPVFQNTDVDSETVAEIITATADGQTLIYTDSETESVGFIDIRDPARPQPGGVVEVGGEPTSVAMKGRFALVAVNTSPSFTAPSGKLVVIDVNRKVIVEEQELGGQPDSIAVSPDQRFVAIVVENERDEEAGDGRPPQQPGGFLVILEQQGNSLTWTTRTVSLNGIADLFPDDPEPEYVDINERNIAAVTLQENNHIVLVDLARGAVINDWSAGTVDLTQVDTEENDLIELNGTLSAIPREPDGVAWISPNALATADEGDLDGGSRGFTIFGINRQVLFSSGNTVEHVVTRLGHYPEGRSENKGNEPEGVEFGRYGSDRLLFVGSERSNVVLVYDTANNYSLLQVLPTGAGPEGLLAIPQRNLFVTASEIDNREDKLRSVVTIYRRSQAAPTYPTVISLNRPDGLPIPWGALSDLAINPSSPNTAYTVYDGFYAQSRIFAMDVGQTPARILNEIVLGDPVSALANVDPSLVNEDGTVNLDLEGVATRQGGGFWVAAEGAGTVGDPNRPVESLNLLLRVASGGAIEEVVTLPTTTNNRQVRFGYEGVASVGSATNEVVYVAFQREWANDPDNRVRIGRYDTVSDEWTFFYYPLEEPTSPNGGWVGLSALAPLGNNQFAVIERDDQGGADARIKRIYRFSIAGLTPLPDPGAGQTPNFPVVEKQLVRNLLPDLQANGGSIPEKLEGLAVQPDGTILVINDNDGLNDSTGETFLLRLRNLF